MKCKGPNTCVGRKKLIDGSLQQRWIFHSRHFDEGPLWPNICPAFLILSYAVDVTQHLLYEPHSWYEEFFCGAISVSFMQRSRATAPFLRDGWEGANSIYRVFLEFGQTCILKPPPRMAGCGVKNWSRFFSFIIFVKCPQLKFNQCLTVAQCSFFSWSI